MCSRYYNLTNAEWFSQLRNEDDQPWLRKCKVQKGLKLIVEHKSTTVHGGVCASQEYLECLVGSPDRNAPNQEASQWYK